MKKELKNAPVNQKIAWSVNKTAVADIDGNGVITAKKNGSVKVTCVIGEGKASTKITSTVVIKTPALSIKDNTKLKNGKAKAVSLKNVDKNGNVNTMGTTSKWKLPRPLYSFKDMENMTFVDISYDEKLKKSTSESICGYDDLFLVIYTTEDDNKYIFDDYIFTEYIIPIDFNIYNYFIPTYPVFSIISSFFSIFTYLY